MFTNTRVWFVDAIETISMNQRMKSTTLGTLLGSLLGLLLGLKGNL